MDIVYKVEEGKLDIGAGIESTLKDISIEKTLNLLENSAFCELFMEKIFLQLVNKKSEFVSSMFVRNMVALYVFGKKIHVYIDQSDDHRDYFLRNSMLSN